MENFKPYLKIPATILPDNTYLPIVCNNLNGKYIMKEDDNPYNSILYPRIGNTYDLEKGFTSDNNGNVTLYINGRRTKIDMIELQEQNDKELYHIQSYIEYERNRILKQKLSKRTGV